MSLSLPEKQNSMKKLASKFAGKFKQLYKGVKRGKEHFKKSKTDRFSLDSASQLSSHDEMPGNSQTSLGESFEGHSLHSQRHFEPLAGDDKISHQQLGSVMDASAAVHLSMKGCRPNRSHPSLLQNMTQASNSLFDQDGVQYIEQWFDQGQSECQSNLPDILTKNSLSFSKQEKVALLVIDVQRVYFTNSDVIQRAFPQFKSNLRDLMQACRNLNFEIVHIRANYQNSKSPFLAQFHKLNPELPVKVHDIETEEFAKEIEGETVVKKWTWSGFDETELDDVLKAKGITTVLGCGLVTTRCVHHTMFGAFNKGYRTVLISDCCADRSVERHNTELYLHGDQMYELHTLEDIHKLEKKQE